MFSPPLPDPIQPVFSTSVVNEHVGLYEGPLDIRAATGATATAHGEVRWRWFPTPDPAFTLTTDDRLLSMAMAGNGEFEIGPEGGGLARAHPSRVDFHGATAEVAGMLEKVEVGGTTGLDHIVFHLPNFLLYGGISFEWDDWRIELSSTGDTSKLERVLQAEGGFALTHVGRLRRSDAAAFNLGEADDVLDALGFFLSFVRGFWTQPCLLVGFDAAGARQCTVTRPLRLDARRATETWYNEYLSASLGEVAAAFWTRWSDATTNESLRLLVSWYLEANGGATALQGRLILAQVALEMLAYEVLTDAQGNEPSGSAGGLVGGLLDTIGVPRTVPAEFPELAALAAAPILKSYPADGDFDAPGVGAAIRNALTHSKRSKRAKRQALLPEHYLQSWQFSAWALELGILAWMGYGGPYAPRFRGDNRSDLEPVPWAVTP